MKKKKKQYEILVMAGISQEVIRQIPGLEEIFKMGLIENVNITMSRGATKVSVEYIPIKQKE